MSEWVPMTLDQNPMTYILEGMAEWVPRSETQFDDLISEPNDRLMWPMT